MNPHIYMRKNELKKNHTNQKDETFFFDVLGTYFHFLFYFIDSNHNQIVPLLFPDPQNITPI